MQSVKGFAAAMVALVACPCHLPLTIPLLLVLTSGTAVGVWLAANTWFVWTGSFVLFIGGLALALVWFRQAETAAQCDVPANKGSQIHTLPVDSAKRMSNSTTIHTQTKEVSHV